MSQQPQFLDLIFLAIIVLLLIGRLRSVLGTRPDGDESKPEAEPRPSKIVDISEYRTLENNPEEKEEDDLLISPAFNEDSEIMHNLQKIKEKYPSFDLSEFMHKAPRAFEYIAQAFAKGDKDELRPLLSPDIYKKFEKAIDERLEKKETAEFSLISFKSIKLLQAEITGEFVDLTVEFETEQTNLIKNAEGETVAGDPTYIETVTDIWTLRKNMKSASPVWILTKTRVKAS